MNSPVFPLAISKSCQKPPTFGPKIGQKYTACDYTAMVPPRSLGQGLVQVNESLSFISFTENLSPILGLYDIPPEQGFSTLAVLTFGAV